MGEDCVVSIDNDDDPSNNGILDFIGISNRMERRNTTIESYMATAQSLSHWTVCPGKPVRSVMIDIGKDELEPYMTFTEKYCGH